MLFYLAPMEGITGYIVRNAYAHYFPYIDKYFTPFIPAAKKMSKKIKRDLAAENNEQIRLVPQLIGNRADEFLMMIRQLEDLGFTSVNLNFGCPSGTVVSKRKGAGFLADPKELEMLLEEVLENSPLAVSVKTRVGIKDPDEWEALCGVCKVSAGRTDYSSAPAERLLQRNTADGNICPCSGADPCAALLQWRYMQCGRL